MTRPAEAFTGLLASLAEFLAEACAEGRERQLAPFREGLARLPTNLALPREPPTGLPVCRYFSEALASATGKLSEIAAALRVLEPFLSFVQNPNYRRAPPTPSFLANYGYAVLAGPREGAPALVGAPGLAFGVLLLGPGTEYPAHHHPAAELYLPLAWADWAKDSPVEDRREWAWREPGCVIYHPPDVVHATRTRATPLAALYLWVGDLSTYARLAD